MEALRVLRTWDMEALRVLRTDPIEYNFVPDFAFNLVPDPMPSPGPAGVEGMGAGSIA